MLSAKHGGFAVEIDEMRQRRARIEDWQRRFTDAKLRSARMTHGDPPERIAAIQAEIEALIAEKEALDKGDA
jgi:hypothetical protein